MLSSFIPPNMQQHVIIGEMLGLLVACFQFPMENIDQSGQFWQQMQ